MTTELKTKLSENSALVEAELESCFAGLCDADINKIFEAEKYSLLGGGKRIRAFLVNEFCRMLGGKKEASMPFAAAIEMIHAYSLIHDDLPCMDDDDMRRGKPSNHKIFGYSTALLAGDALLTRAFLTAASNTCVSDSAIAQAVKVMASAAGDEGMIGGQITDLEGEEKDLSLQQIVKLHGKKTSALIECAALLGCIAAGYDLYSDEATVASSYATKIGLAFQIIDDLLDVIGDEKEIGKTIHSDSDNNKSTFMKYFDCEGAKKYAEELTAEAISDISCFEESQMLTDLAVYLLDRTY